MDSSTNAFNDALRYLKFRARSEAEIFKYLKKRGYNEETLLLVMEKLKKNKFINDELFSRLYAYDALKVHFKGPFRIRIELEKLGVDRYIIETALSEVLEELDVKEILKDVIKRTFKNDFVDDESKEKMKRKLYRKGFSPENIDYAFREFTNDS